MLFHNARETCSATATSTSTRKTGSVSRQGKSLAVGRGNTARASAMQVRALLTRDRLVLGLLSWHVAILVTVQVSSNFTDSNYDTHRQCHPKYRAGPTGHRRQIDSAPRFVHCTYLPTRGVVMEASATKSLRKCILGAQRRDRFCTKVCV